MRPHHPAPRRVPAAEPHQDTRSRPRRAATPTWRRAVVNRTSSEEKRRRYRRGLRWAMALLAFVLIVPLIPYGLVAAEGQLGSNSADILTGI